jgi:hypothetical protein
VTAAKEPRSERAPLLRQGHEWYAEETEGDNNLVQEPRSHEVLLRPVQPGDFLLQDLAIQKGSALSAWFCVDAATFPSTASDVTETHEP